MGWRSASSRPKRTKFPKSYNNLFLSQFKTLINILGIMAYNVPVVCDVFLRPIRKNAKHFYGHKKMCWSKTAQRAKPDYGFAEAEPPKGAKHIQSCYTKWRRTQFYFFMFFYQYKKHIHNIVYILNITPLHFYQMQKNPLRFYFLHIFSKEPLLPLAVE